MQEQNVFTQRIYHGDVEIRRVYLGDNLMWGLYDITYHLAGVTQPSNVVNEYVWGIADIDLPKPTWQGESFFTKFNGWYEGNTYVTTVPAITKDLHEDLELYAKWTQRKYTYSGTYTYSEQVWVGGGGSVEDIRTSYPSTSNDNYDWSAGSLIGECTWYCVGRVHEISNKWLFGSKSTWGNACNWYNNYSGSKSDDDPSAGDVIVWGWSEPDYKVPGHVAVIERINGDGTAFISECNWSTTHGFDNKTLVLGTDRPGNGHTFPFIGYLHSGGGGHWETKTYNVNVSETDNGINQKSPQRPSAPRGSWSQFNEYTYERDYHYNTNGSGEWREDWNQVATSWLPSSQSDGWY